MDSSPLQTTNFGYVTITDDKTSATKLKPLIYSMNTSNTDKEGNLKMNDYYQSVNSIQVPHTASISTTITTIPCTESLKKSANAYETHEIKSAAERTIAEKPKHAMSFDEHRVRANHILEYKGIERRDNFSSKYMINGGRWTRQEHENFLIGLTLYGREWKKVAQKIKTRTSAQIRSHAQKYFAKLAKESNAEKKGTEHASVPEEGGDKIFLVDGTKTQLCTNDSSSRTNKQNNAGFRPCEEKPQNIDKTVKISSKSIPYSPSSSAADTIRSISLLSKGSGIHISGPSDIELVGQMRIFGATEKNNGTKQRWLQRKEKQYNPASSSGKTANKEEQNEPSEKCTPMTTFSFAQDERIKVSHLREEEMCAIEVLLGYMSQSKRPRRCKDVTEDNIHECEETPNDVHNKNINKKAFSKFKGRNFIPIQSYKMSISSKNDHSEEGKSVKYGCVTQEKDTMMKRSFRQHAVEISAEKEMYALQDMSIAGSVSKPCQIESAKALMNCNSLMSAVTTTNQ